MISKELMRELYFQDLPKEDMCPNCKGPLDSVDSDHYLPHSPLRCVDYFEVIVKRLELIIQRTSDATTKFFKATRPWRMEESKHNKLAEIISRERAENAVPLNDCSGRVYSKDEREDIIRYVISGAEIQRDKLSSRTVAYHYMTQLELDLLDVGNLRNEVSPDSRK